MLSPAQYGITSDYANELAQRSETSDDLLRIAVVGNNTTQPIVTATRCALLSEGMLAHIYEAPFDTYRQEILSPNSDLYTFKPDIVVIAVDFSELDIHLDIPMSRQATENALEAMADHWRKLWEALELHLGKPVLQHRCEIPEEEFLGIAERRTRWSPPRFAESLNDRLASIAPNFVKWIDVDRLAARVGRQNWHDMRLYYHGKFGFSPRFLPEYTVLLAAALRGTLGRTMKALILDLDNTLWGGVIGDDGLDGIQLGPDTPQGEAYQSFCRYIKALGRRGVILGICSKNEFSIATEVFDKHPHMPLKLNDFAVVYCNWKDKAANLVEISRELNIDISTLVFVDDNPAECELIRQLLPEIFTIKADGDPAFFVRNLDHLHLFDSQVYSDEDIKRSESYQSKAKSKDLQAKAPDLDSYLQSLGMKAKIKFAEPSELVRLSQMEMKTNQFNLATRRLSDVELGGMIQSEDNVVLSVHLSDCFTEHGLVSYVAFAIANNKIIITDWLMSCRVFSRTLENLIFNYVVRLAVKRKIKIIETTFIPTSKNKVMENMFEKLGFICIGKAPEGPWQYEVRPGIKPLPCFISDFYIE
ncbi:MAG: hypothetical protein DRR42_28115 [Gammaproteobacteria bacterium]|nr:MAG: hypothetical protein DRR42_28115 [Gammaproteobacteria bacterium]